MLGCEAINKPRCDGWFSVSFRWNVPRRTDTGRGDRLDEASGPDSENSFRWRNENDDCAQDSERRRRGIQLDLGNI